MKKPDKTWVYIAVLTVLTALVWTGISVWSALNKPTLPPDVEIIRKPLDPVLDKKILESLTVRH